MDSWYATKEIMLTIEKYGKIYYCPLKDNRQVDDSSGSRPYRRADATHTANDPWHPLAPPSAFQQI